MRAALPLQPASAPRAAAAPAVVDGGGTATSQQAGSGDVAGRASPGRAARVRAKPVWLTDSVQPAAKRPAPVARVRARAAALNLLASC